MLLTTKFAGFILIIVLSFVLISIANKIDLFYLYTNLTISENTRLFIFVDSFIRYISWPIPWAYSLSHSYS